MILLQARLVSHVRLRRSPGRYEPAMFEGSAKPQPGGTDAAQNDGRNERSATDVLCPMYSRVEECVRFVEADDDENGGGRPLILCEYSHAMGNSNGNLDKYWKLFRSHPRCQGGFVWDWVDQGLRKTIRVEGGHATANEVAAGGRTAPDLVATKTWGYGGDFDEPTHDGNFCINGVIWPDREPHPAMEEAS